MKFLSKDRRRDRCTCSTFNTTHPPILPHDNGQPRPSPRQALCKIANPPPRSKHNRQARKTYTGAVLAVLLLTSPITYADSPEEWLGGAARITILGTAGPDHDNDLLGDQAESIIGTDPRDIDTDRDAMPDGWEVFSSLKPLDPTDAQDDFDGDGLSNLQEFHFGSEPFESDTDGDGWHDLVEFRRSTDPADADSHPMPLVPSDLNADGITDATDVQIVINAALGLHTPVPANADRVEAVNAVDVQYVISQALIS